MANMFDIRGWPAKVARLTVVALTLTGVVTLVAGSRFSGVPRFGTSGSSTTMFIGTADGCGRWVFSASNTTPTLTPVASTTCQ